MKRLLCIVGKMDAGGSETFLMKIYRSLDKSKYQIDFCVNTTDKGFYDDEINELGGNIYHSTPKTKGFIKSFKSIYDIVKQNNYKYVMRASQNSLSGFDLLAAKLAGAKVRVFRSTNSRTMRGGYERIIHMFFKPLVNYVSNVKIAPSKKAEKFMFYKSKKNLILNNGIPLNSFIYNEDYNKKMRKDLKISNDTFVVGHIGRFNSQKNHEKIIDIFNEIIKKKPNSVLVLVGKGELENKIKNKINKLNIQKKVIFLGIRNDVNALLSLFDLFLFPSLYEGMPNTIIEAQANGIPCVISNTITEEVKICDNIFMLSLNDKNEEWANLSLSDLQRYKDETNIRKLRDNGYDINDVSKKFIENIFDKI